MLLDHFLRFEIIFVIDLVLAGLRLALRLSRLGGRRRRKVRVRMMEWWRKVALPVRRVWCALSARLKPPTNGVVGLLKLHGNIQTGGGLMKLHNDIQTCGYEDVQIMWEMLRRTTESQQCTEHRCRWFRRNNPILSSRYL